MRFYWIVLSFLTAFGCAGTAGATTFTVTNTNDGGAGSFRQSIADANASSSNDIIEFDPAVFRPSNATWYLNQTTSGVGIVPFGNADDKPVPSAFVP